MLTACLVWGMGEFQVKSTQLLTPMFLNLFLQYYVHMLHCAQAILLSLSALEYSRAESEYKLADMVFCLHRRLLNMKLSPLYDFFAVV